MKLKTLLLPLALITWIRCYAQTASDSLTCLEPRAIDYFLQQDAKAKAYELQLNDCKSDNEALLAGIKEKDTQLALNGQINDLNNQDGTLDQIQIKDLSGQIKKANQQAALWKIGCFSAVVVGITSTIYFIIH